MAFYHAQADFVGLTAQLSLTRVPLLTRQRQKCEWQTHWDEMP